VSKKSQLSKLWESGINIVPQSVGVRVALAVNLLVLVLGMSLLAVEYQWESQHRLVDKIFSLRRQAMTLQLAIAGLHEQPQEALQGFIDAVCEHMSEGDSPGHYIVVEVDGKAIRSKLQQQDSGQSLDSIQAACKHSLVGKETADLLIGQDHEAGISVYVAEKMTNIRADIRRQATVRSLGLVLFGLILAITVNLVIHKLVHKPLRRLVKTIDNIATGDYRKTSGHFDGAELAQVAAAVDSMSHSLLRAEESRKVALDRARRVQEHLLPQNDGENGLDVAFFHIAAEDVAGDYVDVFQTQRGTSIICVADVVGHGVAPAMIASMLKVLLLDAAETYDDPGDIIKLLNHRFSIVSLPEDFATAFLGVWTPANRTLRYVNAGHEPALVLNGDSEVLLLNSTGTIVGLEAATLWETQSIQIAPGGILASWTDGITEAWQAATEEQFGRDRLIAIIKQHAGTGPRVVSEKIRYALQEYGRNGSPDDDCTFVAIRFV
jgi:serine phosphatase RsbU (regulator of sigma subunit)